MMYLILLSGLSVFGLVLLVIGMRGKCVDNHPLCRKCKYDLVGTAELPAKCPECGSVLNKPRATRIGNRVRNRTMLTISALILLLSLTIGSFLGWATYTNTDWNPYKPFWLLKLDAASADSGAQNEMLSRLTGNNLSREQTQQLIKDGLDWQADQTLKWDPFWGDFIESAWQQGEVSDADIKQYLRKTIEGNIEFIFRRKIRSGESVPYRRKLSNLRCANKSAFRLWTYYKSMRLKDTDFQYIATSQGLSSLSASGSHSGGSSARFDAPPGKYKLIVEYSCNILPANKVSQTKFGGSALSETENLKSITVTDWIKRFEIPIEVVEPNAPVFELVDDPTLTEAISKAIDIRMCEISRKSDDHNWGDLVVRANSLPIAISFEVIWRIDQKDWKIGGLATAKKDGFVSFQRNWEGNLDDFPADATTVDIILRSNPKYAEHEAGIEKIWQGEIIILDQPILRAVKKQ